MTAKQGSDVLATRTELIFKGLAEVGLLGDPNMHILANGEIDIEWKSKPGDEAFWATLSLMPAPATDVPETYLLQWGSNPGECCTAWFYQEDTKPVIDVLRGLFRGTEDPIVEDSFDEYFTEKLRNPIWAWHYILAGFKIGWREGLRSIGETIHAWFRRKTDEA